MRSLLQLAHSSHAYTMRGMLIFYGTDNMTDPHVLSRRPKAPTQARGERRVTNLLRAAEHLFATTGYDATPMSGIAQLAGASIGSLYQFFPSKESIGSALLLEYMNELSGQVSDLKGALPDTPRALGEKLVAMVFDYISARPACRVLAEEPAVPKADGLGKLSASVEGLLPTFAPSMNCGELSFIALAISLMVRATVQGSRLVEAKTGPSLVREMQRALGSYLEHRLTPPTAPLRPPASVADADTQD
ncbi:TetR/AcrR family transcriptional regulator [Paraburkholderia hospita]|uniref:TetR/AcrR family transcriptional regulator n=1 Tax=Paraburkholderia hospita TaxID=169430 RepID=UPI0009A90BDC|nr:transcriptional regulator, TetR family [Paraburkholderia hospita]